MVCRGSKINISYSLPCQHHSTNPLKAFTVAQVDLGCWDGKLLRRAGEHISPLLQMQKEQQDGFLSHICPGSLFHSEGCWPAGAKFCPYLLALFVITYGKRENHKKTICASLSPACPFGSGAGSVMGETGEAGSGCRRDFDRGQTWLLGRHRAAPFVLALLKSMGFWP